MERKKSMFEKFSDRINSNIDAAGQDVGSTLFDVTQQISGVGTAAGSWLGGAGAGVNKTQQTKGADKNVTAPSFSLPSLPNVDMLNP